MVTIRLPAIQVPPHTVATAAGHIVAPGYQLVEKVISVDPEIIKTLVIAARGTAQRAYAPYSQFSVGSAAIMADDPGNKVYCGANIENSSYGATVCAERSALFNAASRGFRKLKYLAVSTADALQQPLSERSPCGVCRQVLKEFTAQDVNTDQALILIDNGDPDVLCEVFDIERLLPYGFNFSGPDESLG